MCGFRHYYCPGRWNLGCPGGIEGIKYLGCAEGADDICPDKGCHSLYHYPTPDEWMCHLCESQQHNSTQREELLRARNKKRRERYARHESANDIYQVMYEERSNEARWSKIKKELAEEKRLDRLEQQREDAFKQKQPEVHKLREEERQRAAIRQAGPSRKEKERNEARSRMNADAQEKIIEERPGKGTDVGYPYGLPPPRRH